MADFVEWAIAAETDIEEMSGFLDAYNENQNAVTVAGVEASPVGKAVMALMDSKDEWNGMMSELHTELESFISEDVKKSRAWPKAANWLSNKLRRLGSSLRKIGIDITLPEQVEDRQIHIKKILQSGKIDDIAELPQEIGANRQSRQFPDDVVNEHAVANRQIRQFSEDVKSERTLFREEF